MEEAGAGIALARLDPDALRHAIKYVLIPEHRDGIVSRGPQVVPKNGADRAAEAILDLLPG